ncbi:phosphotransferase family protein [Apiospora kogelbergensis]|uniref:phosphotransferase family protein n=1 Tax=Apiospora kogelbergensis TaxID=1337665 RepID=UPI00313171B8
MPRIDLSRFEGATFFWIRYRGPIPWRLFSKDLRPTNVLVNKDLRVVAVIDWEFAYATPSQFSFDPPWWLLLARPEYWPDGYESFIDIYKRRLEAFPRILEGEERNMKVGSEKAGTTSSMSIDWKVPLSQRLRES